jgi:Kef-type K+ transport system membrane component KefB
MALLGILAAVIIATKLLAEVAQRLGQPAVLGELLAGVLLGASALGLFDPHDPVLHALADIGVLVLMFQIGLHTDSRSLRRVGGTAMTVAAVGVVLPFAGGVLVARLLGFAPIPSLLAGAALTATSIGISARVLSDVGRLQTAEGQVVLGAAVADDIIGLIILSVVAAVAAGGNISALGVVKLAAVAVGFVVVALAMGSVAIPPFFRVVERIRITGALGLIALAFALLLALLAMASGSAMIIGAFAAGLILHPTPQRHEIERNVTSLGHFFVPIFFASVGASVDLRALATGPALLAGAVLVVVGVLGKVAAGYAPWWFEGNKLLVGVAMVPRGEVGLIFAQMGLASAAISPALFGALMLMVVTTTFVTPPLLLRVAKGRRGPITGEWSGDGGIDDLVAGTRPQPSRKTVAVPKRNKAK